MNRVCGNCRHADFKSLKDNKVFRGFAFCSRQGIKGVHYLNRNSTCRWFEKAGGAVMAARKKEFG